MKYYYLDGIDKLGPYSLDEIKSRKLSLDTMILREDKTKWAPLSDYEELQEVEEELKREVKTKEVVTQKSDDKKKSSSILKFSLLGVLIIIISFFLYQHFSLTEDKSRDLANRFFNAVLMENLDYNIIEEIYPDFRSIGSRIDFQNTCVINNISSNSDGDFEVYATYNHNENNSYPIYLLIGNEKGNAYIKSSRGINYAFYDKVYDFGKKKGCFSDNEDDVEIGKIIHENSLRSDFEYLINIGLSGLYDNLEISSKLSRDRYGWTDGDVTIKNNNEIDFTVLEFDCRVEFYDSNEKLVHTKELHIFNLDANSSTSTSVMSTQRLPSNYRVIPTIKKSYRIENLIKDKVIKEAKFGCF
ncbi:DUF4339 domain-containing protein [Hyunsoonleella flava]|uniref:DUF4339 domain-containing protein n=1 Tax=Hyunsoonleella flava TaxID=2527939 RepID=A0A4Q9FCZ6_9FLAO|nr:GYF domain-containing protein [Hyunsoonleella flava]TBN03221.1 DUF4339 domain-containing protein [Hyunsoonleella flava]